MRARLRAEAPDVAPALIVVALLVWITVVDGGYPITRWAPVGMLAAILLGARLAIAPPTWRALPRPVLVATAALGTYAVWSGLSVLWASDRGVAWQGAGRTLTYALLFALVALWPLRRRQAAVVTGAWALAIAVCALIAFVHLATADEPLKLFIGDRVLGPAGYVNASAALWLMAFWPALLLAAAPGTPPVLRGVLVAGAAVLGDVALLSQSRGTVVALPVTAVALLVALPGRVRLFGALVVVAAAIGAATPALLHVGEVVRSGADPSGALRAGLRIGLAGALAAGAVVAVGGLLLRRRAPGPRVTRGAHLAGSAAMGVVAVAAVAAALVIGGGPSSLASRGWHSFKHGYATSSGTSRLSSGLGSNRYDFYRVGLDVWRAHPVVGVGADNFREDYLRLGRSDETPAYPHSVEIRALVSTGLVGAVLLLAFAGAVGVAVVRSARGPAGVAGVAAIGAFVYWAIHGSADWLWEIAGLGGAAFAAAAIALAAGHTAKPASRGGPGARVLGAALAVVTIAALAFPYLAARDIGRAGETFRSDPALALGYLRRAGGLVPVDPSPPSVEGAAWLRSGNVDRARAAFAEAHARDPHAFAPVLQLAAIASSRGERDRAATLIAAARRLAPRDPVAAQVQRVVRSGRRVDLGALQLALAGVARDFTRP